MRRNNLFMYRFFVAAFALFVASSVVSAVQDDDRYEADEKAAKAFAELVKHYRELPGVQVDCEMQVEMQQGEEKADGEKVIARFMRGLDQAGTLELRGFTCTMKNGSLWMIHESTDHSYYTEKYDDSPYWPLLMSFQDLPFPMLAIFWGESEMPDLWMQLNSRTPMIVPTKVEDVTDENGNKERLITLTSPDASMVIHQNPETKLINSVMHEITGGTYVQPGVVMRSTYTYTHKVYEKPGDVPVVAFETGGRQRVDFIAALVDRPPPQVAGGIDPGQMPAMPDPGAALEGNAAPLFDLPTLDGANLKLADLRGQVVVLDFWATWCPPCRKALPLLHQVGDWAKKEQLPVTIIAVNCWEHGDDDAARAKAAGDFWASQMYTLPVAMDHTAAVATAYGVSGIPTTVVIRPDGVVHAYHVGASPNYVDDLRDEIEAALEAAAGDAAAGG